MIRTWYVGFVQRKPEDTRAWFSVLTPDAWAHVLCMGFDAQANAWVVYDPVYTAISLTVHPAGDPVIDACIKAVPNWLSWPAEKTRPLRTFGLTWCVPAVRRIIGFQSCALRPEALYRDLVKHGAQKAFTDCP